MRRARFIERQTSVSAALASVFLDAPSIELPQAAHNQRAVRSGCQLRAVLLREALSASQPAHLHASEPPG